MTGQRTRPWVVVDAMNVIGSRPDGWWRDRDGAVRDFVARMRRYAAGRSEEVTVVVDGRPVDGLEPGRHGAVEVVFAPGGRDAADDRIIELLSGEGDRDTTVVTADRELRGRAAARGAALVGPSVLLARLDELDGGPGRDR